MPYYVSKKYTYKYKYFKRINFTFIKGNFIMYKMIQLIIQLIMITINIYIYF